MAGSDSLPDQGFADPSGRHPLRNEGPDTSYSAIGALYETTAPFIIKNDLRVERIETGAPAKVSSIVQDEADAYYERKTWNMPHIAFFFNSVTITN